MAPTGHRKDFGHTQLWFPPATVYNPYLGNATAVRQYESWFDSGNAEGPLVFRYDRDLYQARGYGMAWKIQNYHWPDAGYVAQPSNWLAYMTSFWDW